MQDYLKFDLGAAVESRRRLTELSQAGARAPRKHKQRPSYFGNLYMGLNADQRACGCGPGLVV